MRLTILSMPCAAGIAAARVLLKAAEHEVGAVVLAGPEIAGDTLADEATGRGVPLRWVDRASVADAVRASRPDLLVVACFPWRLSPEVLAIPRLGGVNIHPSLLPALRGPEPIFWTYRHGLRTTGVTVHELDAEFDHGAILAQAALPVPPGSRGEALEAQLMEVGATLLVEALPGVERGSLRAVPQDETRASNAPSPTPGDLVVSSMLPASWAWGFVRGVSGMGGPLVVHAGGRAIAVRDALAFDPEERLAEAVHEEADGKVTVRFSPGWVRFQVAGD